MENLSVHFKAHDIFLENRASKTVTSLIKNDFDAHYVKNKKDAAELVLSMIPGNATIALGGSLSIRELGIYELLSERGHIVNDRWTDPDVDIRNRLISDVFIASTNAVTMDGKLINLDGMGSRASCMIFGPKKVILIVGNNKIVSNVDEGIQRTRNVAAGMIYTRKNMKTPCATLGYCTHCELPIKQCRVLTIHEGKPKGIPDYHIIIVGEPLGY